MSGSGFERISISLWCDTGVENHENERLPNPVWNGFLEQISISLWCETGVENNESERCPDPVLSGFLCRFGATQGSKIMTMNDVRIRFSVDFYIASVRNSCRE